MLRLWKHRIELFVGPGTVRGRWMAGRRPAPLATARRDGGVLGGAVDSPLQDCLADLLQSTRRSPRGVGLDVTVDDRLVWLDVVQGDFAGCSQRELALLAEAAAAEVLGDELSRLDLRADLQKGGRHLVLMAMPQALVDQVRNLAEERHLRLLGLKAAFVRAWNGQCKSVSGKDLVFAWHDRGEAVLARVHGGALTAISRPRHVPDEPALDAACRRLQTRLGDDSLAPVERVLVSSGEWSSSAGSSWQMRLPGTGLAMAEAS